MWKKWLCHESLRAGPTWINFKVSVRIWLYTLCPIFTIIQKYITGDHMLTSSQIFSGLIYSTCVPYLYELIRRILCLIFIRPHCTVTVPSVQHGFIANVPLYGVSHIFTQRYYWAWLYLQLYSRVQFIFYFCVFCLY